MEEKKRQLCLSYYYRNIIIVVVRGIMIGALWAKKVETDPAPEAAVAMAVGALDDLNAICSLFAGWIAAMDLGFLATVETLLPLSLPLTLCQACISSMMCVMFASFHIFFLLFVPPYFIS